ncbi:hypothetical protein NUW58_g7147 [Xylaria curta]|uniref:Uncharacterized protein n=1 Tax=Xylaria curta TaxID=42375 RepID=A0ACC1NL82_9PEZI|nr:hypothetical protein NUW58_g7147 [Xylaria curta]
MPILLISASPSSFRVGLRTAIRAPQSYIASFAVPTIRALSTSQSFSRQSCCQYNLRDVARPFTAACDPISRKFVSQIQIRTIFTFRVLVHYIDLPDSYRDAEGLPFRREDLSQREANKIFPSNLPAAQANLLLKILHGRRVAGTLDDPILAQNTRQFRIPDQKKALEYLREHIPVDEVLNAGLRAEDELKVIEEQGGYVEEVDKQLEKTSSQHSSPTSQDEADEAPTGRLPRKRGSDSPYGESNFDRIRARNIAKREAEEARIEEERKLWQEGLTKGDIGTLQTQQEKPKEMSEFRKKYLKEATSDLEAPPEMTVSQRLLPSFAMAVLIIFCSMGFAALYQAPPPSQRLWPNISPATATCLGLIAANVAVWALWKFPPAWAFLNKYMVLLAATPRPLQIIGAMFSHHSFAHLVGNMCFLWFFGTRMHDEIGRGGFLALYLSSGAVGFAASLANLVLWRGLNSASLGASGGIYGLVTAFFWMHKFDEFKVLGYPPDPISGPQGLGFIGLILGIHLVPMFLKHTTSIDMVSHFGGMVAGVLGIELAGYYAEYEARRRAERLQSTGVSNTVVAEKHISATNVDAPSSPSPER